MAAIGATYPRKTFFEITTLQKGGHGFVDDGTPVTVLALITVIVDLPEGLEMFIDQTPQVRGSRVAWLVQRERLDTRYGHKKSGVETCPAQYRDGQIREIW